MAGIQAMDLTERARLLLMAAYVHGAGPNAEIRANCGRVLRQALRWAGLWNEQLEHNNLYDIEDPVIADWYRTLISMTRRADNSELLIEGQGNLGSPVDPPAFPTYTGCRLTRKGRELAEKLFAAAPLDAGLS